MWFQNFITYLIFDKNWNWLEYLICMLAMLEVEFSLLMNKKLLKELRTVDVGNFFSNTTYAMNVIPKQSFYCTGCPFRTYSKIAKFFFGEQSSGYCHYLKRGDFSFGNSTNLLWDACKECGINEDIEE